MSSHFNRKGITQQNEAKIKGRQIATNAAPKHSLRLDKKRKIN